MARVLWIGTFDPDFARNRKLARLLELGGHDVSTVSEPIWGARRYEIPTGPKVSLVAKAVLAYPRLVWALLRAPRPDVVLFSYPGWFDAIVLGAVARLRGIPVIFDVFISLYDTVVSDRRLVRAGGLAARALRAVDRLSLRRADRVIADTPPHADFFAGLAGIDRHRVDVVWLGAQDDVFSPLDGVEPEPDLVLFHGTFIGLQGLDTIVRAAKLLEADGIRVRIVGSGQEQPLVDRLLAELAPSNVELTGLVPLADVPRQIASAAVCLGIFGTSAKAARVVPNKLYECLAVGRPVVTGDTPAVRSAFGDEVARARTGDPEDLARVLRALLADPGEQRRLGRAGHDRYRAEYHERTLAALLDRCVAATLRSRAPQASTS